LPILGFLFLTRSTFERFFGRDLAETAGSLCKIQDRKLAMIFLRSLTLSTGGGKLIGEIAPAPAESLVCSVSQQIRVRNRPV
jgi:hypothetical protein